MLRLSASHCRKMEMDDGVTAGKDDGRAAYPLHWTLRPLLGHAHPRANGSMSQLMAKLPRRCEQRASSIVHRTSSIEPMGPFVDETGNDSG